MKKKTWIFIFLGITAFVLIVLLLIPIIFDVSWWWFGIPSIILLVAWIIAGTILIIKYFKYKKPKIEILEIEEYIEIAKRKSVMHPDNPDNFIYISHETTKVSEPGAEVTPILVIHGEGSELREDRYFIIEKNTKEDSLLINPSKEKLRETIIQIAKSQPRPVITEQVPSTDAFGRPTTKFITKSTSRAELEKKEEEEKEEEKTAF